MPRIVVLASCLLMVLGFGCGGPDPLPESSLAGSFRIIEGAANDLADNILHPKYRPARDLGSDSDRIGMALTHFMKAVEGTSHTADAEKIKEKINALEKLAATRAALDKQRAAAKDLKDTVNEIKAKL